LIKTTTFNQEFGVPVANRSMNFRIKVVLHFLLSQKHV